MIRWWGLTALLVACGGSGTYDVTWTSGGDGLCIDSNLAGRAYAGPQTLDVLVAGSRRGKDVELAGLEVRLFEVDPVRNFPELIAEDTLDATGALSFDVDVQAGSEGTVGYHLGIEGTDAFEGPVLVDEPGEEPLLTFSVVASDVRAWIGCQEWRATDLQPIAPNERLSVGSDVVLSYHVAGDITDAEPIEIVFRERGGDLCGPDPFGHFADEVEQGQNDVLWTVDVTDMALCESEAGPSELTFSTPDTREDDGTWHDFRESAEREVDGSG